MLIEKMTAKKFLNDYSEELSDENFKLIFKNEDNIQDEIKIGDKDPEFTITLNGSLSKMDIIKNPSLTLGEAYMDGLIDAKGDLFKALVLIMNIRKDLLSRFSLDHDFLKKDRDHSKEKQKEEVSSHYDIGNDFYKLWLDETMNYSCAYFENEDDSLFQAQTNKVHYIIKKLQLEDGMTLLDIGCGWGDLIISAAKKYDIKATGITLSEEQHEALNKKIQDEGLEKRVNAKLMDYRDLVDLDCSFDRVVSVGMIEHVGDKNYDLFLDNVKHILKDKGIFLLHFISGHDEDGRDPWINKYIFPGGVLPSLREIIHKGVDREFHIVDVESLRRHYVKTLLSWHENFEKEVEKVHEMFDERFVRMWRLYLLACAANFYVGGIDIHEVLFTNKVNNELPMTRDFLYN